MTQSPEHVDEHAVVRSPGRADRPIVLLLHGLGSHERDLAALAPHLPDAYEYASLRGIRRHGQGYAWFGMPLDPEDPSQVEASAAAVEAWAAGQREAGRRVVGAIGFSQGALLALHLLRRDARAMEFAVVLSGWPFPAPMPGDAALAEVAPPVLWGHGGLDPLVDTAGEEAVRRFLTAHTRLEEVRRPALGHAVDEVEVQAISDFLSAR